MSNYFLNGIGFKLSYESTYATQWSYSSGNCGGSFTTPYGFLSSPSYPKEYPDNLDCIYTISQPMAANIDLKIRMFDLFEGGCASTSRTYKYDYLEIRGGLTNKSLLIGKFCGSIAPFHIQVKANNVWMKWVYLDLYFNDYIFSQVLEYCQLLTFKIKFSPKCIQFLGAILSALQCRNYF